jgi:hypothetical protein
MKESLRINSNDIDFGIVRKEIENDDRCVKECSAKIYNI